MFRPISLATQDGVLNLIDDEDEGDDAVAEGPGGQPFGGTTERPSIDVDAEIALALGTGDAEADVDPNYGLLAPQQMVLLRAYSDDTDDQVLEELRPRFIIMYEPNQDFVRRIEVRRPSARSAALAHSHICAGSATRTRTAASRCACTS